MSGSNFVFVFTGSIAAYKACEVVSQLVQRGHRVRVVATEAALRFVGAPTLEGLTGAPVLSDMFAAGAALEHIQLTRWADAVVVCPATAHTLNRLAAGLADDLPGALYLAHDRAKPWLFAPAMNPAMWSHPATEAAVEKLRGWGAHFIAPGTGRTACGEAGEGRLAEPAVILAALERAVARPRRRLHVLVTAGGTAEPIDGVRVLTNRSTGRTGALIAGELARCGHEVLLVRAGSAPPVAGVPDETFETFAQLDAVLRRQLAPGRFDAVIHAAAVSDFGVESVEIAGAVQAAGGPKLDSSSSPLLRLRPNPKLVDAVRGLSPAPLQVVAFKLTHGAAPAEAERAVRGLLAHSGADWVVHNDTAAQGAAPDEFPATLHDRTGAIQETCATRPALAAALERRLVNAALSA